MPQPSPEDQSPAGSRTTVRERLMSRIVPRLTFEEPLESQFSQWYREHTKARIRNVIWLPVAGLLALVFAGGRFNLLREAIYGAGNQGIINFLRFAVIAPSCVAMLAVAYSPLYERWFGTVAQVIAPLHATCFVIMDLLMHPQGYSLSSWMPLVVLAPYFTFGMLHRQAVRSAGLIVAIYAVGGYATHLQDGQRTFDLAVLIFTGSLGTVVHYSLQKAVRQNYLATQLLSDSVHRDALTGIHNRRMFDQHIERVWQQGMRANVPLALLMIDIDHFKAFNDRGGHQAGDACLIKVASVISRAARRPMDLTARYGGEEFAVLLYDAGRDRVEELCRQLHAGLASLKIAHPALATGVDLTFSIGAACVEPQANRRVEGFIQLADEALYAAKERGRNRSVVMDREYETMETGSFRSGTKNRSAAA
ncbi:MAG TPA: GGDEF domain-containing protein [Steroidobacteraceae bacterium]|jgi:diguanylate cyclase (GGDEF)-like protein